VRRECPTNARPELIGDGVKVVTFEFGRWITGTATPTAERLDVLVELKQRDRAPDTVTMQAINYAAMVHRFSLDTLADVHAEHLGAGATPHQAREQLTAWASGIADETLGPPRVVLIAAEFGPIVTNTALFLREVGLDIRLVRYHLFRTAAGELVLSVAQLLPIPELEQFMVRPRSSRPATASTSGEQRPATERRPSQRADNRDDDHGPRIRRP
jgi:hypothetical protein